MATMYMEGVSPGRENGQLPGERTSYLWTPTQALGGIVAGTAGAPLNANRKVSGGHDAAKTRGSLWIDMAVR